MAQNNKTAEDFAKMQKEISISEFFEKNKHLLGFDNPTKALMMVVKEAVDNSIDATVEAGILPDIKVRVEEQANDIFKISVEDNGPGIVKAQIPKIFGKLLYGSKFHRLKQQMGQQGIGISASVMFSQLTTGNASRIFSKPASRKKTYMFEIRIDTRKNEAEIVKEDDINDSRSIKNHGTRIELKVKGRYRRKQGIDDYLKQIAVANPFAKITYYAPDKRRLVFERTVNELPREAREMKPHPYGVEFGTLFRMLKMTKSHSVEAFLQNDFSSVGNKAAKLIAKTARLTGKEKPKKLDREQIEKLLGAMQKTKIQRPPTDCLSPIGEEELKKGLENLYPEADFVVTKTRKPEVYRGNPFIIETGIVYDKNLDKDRQIKIIRLANKVPLLYQAGAGAVNESITGISWKRYGMQQSRKSIPSGPFVVVVHMCSTWVPFISESKEAIAPYPEIIKEIKLALQDCARVLKTHLRKQIRAKHETKRLQIFESYLPLIAESATELAEMKKKPNIKPIINKVIKVGLIAEDAKALAEMEKPRKLKIIGGSDD
jgi:DNA topoisomerase-6 subunit B